jgi:hypothetical protein
VTRHSVSTTNDVDTTDHYMSLANHAVTRRIQDVLDLLHRQETIGPGQKALLDNGTLRRDTMYETSGDLGRWFMNTLVRPVSTTSDRQSICDHCETLVSKIESVYTLLPHDPCRQEQMERRINSLLITLESVKITYTPSTVHERLEECQVRLRYLTTSYLL